MSRPVHHARYSVSAVRSLQIFLAFLTIVCFPSSLLTAAQEHAANPTSVAKEIWAESRLAGQPAGYYHERTETTPENQVLTIIDNDFAMNREGSVIEVKTRDRFEESGDGKLLAVKADVTSSKQLTHVDATVQDRSILIRTTTGGKTYERSLPFTGTLIGPHAARQLMLGRLKSPGDSFAYQTFSPEFGSVLTLTNTLVGPEQLTVDGKQWSSAKIEQTISAIPGNSHLWLDSEGWLLRLVTHLPFGDLDTVRASQSEIRPVTTGASLPSEVYGRSVVHANVRLPQERLIEDIKIRISHRKPELGWPDLTADNQRVLEKTADYIVLEVHRILPQKDARRSVANRPDLAQFLTPNPLLQSDDARIQAIAQKVVGNDASLLRSAHKLEKWTDDHMSLGMDVAIAPASEVVQDRRGTCIAYSVLLASLARAAGIPSRVRMGYVYADGAWAGHAWVEVLDGDQWIGLDGALYAPEAPDAARFSFLTSALEEGTLSPSGAAQLYGNVDIEILEYTVNGRHVVVPENAPAFAVDGDVYRNPWLGLTVTKPESFKFTKLSEVWPDNTIVAMEGPDKESVEIVSESTALPDTSSPDYTKLLDKEGISGKRSVVRIAGDRAVMVSSAGKAGLVLARGGDIWVVKATGPHAPKLLTRIAEGVMLGKQTAASASLLK